MGTANTLLKWKYAHMNSVDFLLRCARTPDGKALDTAAAEPLRLFLLDQDRRGAGGAAAMVPVNQLESGAWAWAAGGGGR